MQESRMNFIWICFTTWKEYLHEFQLKWITVTVYEYTIFKKNFAKIKILIHVISMQSKIHMKISCECNSFYRGSLGQDISGLTVRPAWNVTYFIWKTQYSPFSEPWHTSNAYKYTYPIFLCVVLNAYNKSRSGAFIIMWKC